MRTYDRNFKLIHAGADFVCLPGYALYLQTEYVQKKEIVRFYMGNRFHNRQVNNFLVNQGVIENMQQ